ncbi:hypothetical protein F511_27959 [Dorcoceras hygrometricum]|uniref:Uncharacterized protein n=1 Tax=Dorcoceras hygrometricum TaxID=472368 RepID=A0A2Z7AT63_9LAMI|nr:hypothetical protein F511_27959 [Dorcoceras hygrometricum]
MKIRDYSTPNGLEKETNNSERDVVAQFGPEKQAQPTISHTEQGLLAPIRFHELDWATQFLPKIDLMDKDYGRYRQSGPRPDTRLLRQLALEGVTRSARTDSPRRIGRNEFRRLAEAAAIEERRGGYLLLGDGFGSGPTGPGPTDEHSFHLHHRDFTVTPIADQIGPIDSVSKTKYYDLKNHFSEPQCKMTILPLNSGKPRTCVTLNGSGIQLAVGPQSLWLRNHNYGLAQRIMSEQEKAPNPASIQLLAQHDTEAVKSPHHHDRETAPSTQEDEHQALHDEPNTVQQFSLTEKPDQQDPSRSNFHMIAYTVDSDEDALLLFLKSSESFPDGSQQIIISSPPDSSRAISKLDEVDKDVRASGNTAFSSPCWEATMRRVVNYHSSWARQQQVELFDASDKWV